MKKTPFLFYTIGLTLVILIPLSSFCQLDSTDFVTTWKTDNYGTLSNNDSSITINTSLPLQAIDSLSYDYDVDWNNDGIFDTLGVTGNVTYKYNSVGTYTIRIRGHFPGIRFGGYQYNGPFPYFVDQDCRKLVSVNQWGGTSWKELDHAFEYCVNLNISATDAPNLDSLNNSSLIFMFRECESLNANLNHWDVSSVHAFSSMFDGALSFNKPLNDWDVASAIYMDGMFRNSVSFNQPLNHWDVSNVTNMGGMFQNAKAFDQNLGDWDISSVQATAVPLVNGMWAMLDSIALSVENYDSTLIGWSSQPHYPNIGVGCAGLKYCLAKSARDSLMADGWIFYGDTLDPNCISISIGESNLDLETLIYPNPSSGLFTIDFNKRIFTGNLIIYSLNGQLVFRQEVNAKPKLEFNLPLEPGVYLLQINSPNGNLNRRLIIQ